MPPGAANYYYCEMLKNEEFRFFCYCENNWKLKHYITQTYPSFKNNHHPEGTAAKKKSGTKSAPKPSSRLSSPAPPSSGTSDYLQRTNNRARSSSQQPGIREQEPIHRLRDPLLSNGPLAPSKQQPPPAVQSATPPQAGNGVQSPESNEPSHTPPPAGPSSADASQPPQGLGNHCKRGRPMASGQQMAPAAKKRKLAKAGKTKSEENFCRTEWLKTNQGGYEDDFQAYYSALTEEERQPFHDLANAAQPVGS
ncbi:hypothetical protein C0991_012135 [Blastosporella zonata]|nr:hypothetical protein C0991_012135 [Blastosporella zonata]